jgi:hypothetical protein
MKLNIMFLIASILCFSTAIAGDITLEAAAGLGSPDTPYSSHWNGTVGGNGLYHREFAFRGGCEIQSWLSASTMIGFLKNRGYVEDNLNYPAISPNQYHYFQGLQDVVYIIPSFRFSLSIIRFDLGTIIYFSSLSGDPYSEFDYPFNGSHRFKPTLGIELGETQTYIFARYLDSFPFYASGLGAIGIGGRVGGIYEHQGSIIGGPYGVLGIGYRGEFRVYHQTAISASFFLAGVNDNENVFLLSLGVKTIIK